MSLFNLVKLNKLVRGPSRKYHVDVRVNATNSPSPRGHSTVKASSSVGNKPMKSRMNVVLLQNR